MIFYTALLAAILLFIGILFLYFLQKQKKNFGVLNSERFYTDSDKSPGKVLYSKTIPLVGKPDYIIRQNNYFIPVELKTSKTPRTPYENHIMQLMAYCYLVEETYHIPPPGGFLKYPEKEFYIPYTTQAKEGIRATVKEILQKKKINKENHCNHQSHYNN